MMKNFFTKNKGTIIFAAIVLIALTVSYISGGNTEAPVSNVVPRHSAPIQTDENICRISIRCDDILANMSTLNPDKAEFVPEGGIILAETDITFTPGETAFDIIKRVDTEKGIVLDYTTTSVTYIRGIGNLYEKDCGPMSGWGFYLNGESAEMSCDNIKINAGDVIEWTYTCDFSTMYQ